jgi:hypothetical protein
MTDDGAVAHVIQLSVAPVFLISGIGAFLGVMTNRLARAVDRARVLAAQRPAGAADAAAVHAELRTLSRRATLLSVADGMLASAALRIGSPS